MQNNGSRDFPASDGGNELVKVRYLADVRKLVQYHPNMDGQPPAVFIIGPVTKQVDKLALYHCQNEIKGGVRVRHNQEQRRFLVPDGVKFQFVVLHQLPDFPDVKRGHSCACADKD